MRFSGVESLPSPLGINGLQHPAHIPWLVPVHMSLNGVCRESGCVRWWELSERAIGRVAYIQSSMRVEFTISSAISVSFEHTYICIE